MSKSIEIEKVICIDATNKPNEISQLCWLKKGEEYTIVKLCVNALSKDQYFVLEEIHPDNPLYGGYNVKRFGISQDYIKELIEAGKFEEILT